MPDAAHSTPQALIVPARRAWTIPLLRELPKLTELTLTSAVGGGGGTGGGGSTVFGLLLAAGLVLLSACSADQSLEPSAPAMPRSVAAVQCQADVASGALSCGGPAGAPGQEILGGQGISVLLGTTIVVYNTNDSSFAFLATVKNLSAQPIGIGLNGPGGIRIFFQQVPHPLIGTGAITFIGDSIGTFTASNQHYYVNASAALLPMQTSGGTLIKFHVPPTVQTFAFTVLISTEVVDAGGPVNWRPVAGRSADLFHAIAFATPTDAIAVGRYGHASRWDGTRWRSLVPYTSSNFNAVASLGGGEYVAVGDGGVIWKLKGNVWTQVYTESHGYALTQVWARGSGQFVAGGEAGATVTYAGAAFTEQVLAAPGDTVIGVTGKSDGSVVAVLLQSNALFQGAGGAPFAQVNAITGVGAGVIYDANDQLLWAYFDSNTWDAVLRSDAAEVYRTAFEWPVAITSFSPSDAVIAFFNPFSLDGHVDDVNFGTLPATRTAMTGSLPHRVRSLEIDGGIFFMATTDDALLSWNGTVHDEQPLAGPTPELWGIGDTAWVVTGDGAGTVGRIVNGVLTERAPSPYGGARHITGISSSEVYIADNTFLWRSYGNSWGYEYGVSFGNIAAIWGDTATGNLIVMASNGDLKTRIGGGWHDYDAGVPAGSTLLWGCSATNAWVAVGDQLWRWNGTSSSHDLNYAANAFSGQIRAISGSSCTDIWVAHDNGVAHFDGTNWADAHVSGMTAVVPRSPGLAWLLNGVTSDRIGAPDGTGWEIQVPTQQRPITAAWRLANGNLLVAGNGFLLLGGN